jgi:two-component system nitrate/nitrite response regulator NarL
MSNHAGVPASGVAEKLHISEHTLRNHLTAIYYKLSVTSRLGLFAYAQNHGLDKLPLNFP